jgi:hypothetical protein
MDIPYVFRLKNYYQMKQLINFNLPKGFAILFLCTILFSFANVDLGGEHYAIYLNDKLLVEKHVTSKATPLPTITLKGANPGDRLSVYYNECGKIGTNRRLSLKDEKGNLLKEFRFNDATGEHTPLSCLTEDIQKLWANGNPTVTLFYSSKLVSPEIALATLTFGSERKAIGG